jgi:hypothetical protein
MELEVVMVMVIIGEYLKIQEEKMMEVESEITMATSETNPSARVAMNPSVTT